MTAATAALLQFPLCAAEDLTIANHETKTFGKETVEVGAIRFEEVAYPGADGTLRLNGTTMSATGLYSCDGGGNSARGVIELREGATLTISGPVSYSTQSYGRGGGTIDVQGNSSLTFDGSGALEMGAGAYNTENAYSFMRIFGQDAAFSLNRHWYVNGHHDIRMTNSLVTSTAGASFSQVGSGGAATTYMKYTNDFQFVGSDVSFDGNVVFSHLASRILVSGGRFATSGGLTFANDWQYIDFIDYTDWLVVTNGATLSVGGVLTAANRMKNLTDIAVSSDSTVEAANFTIGGSGRSIVRAAGATVTVTSALVIGSGVDARGFADIADGTLAAGTLTVGASGAGGIDAVGADVTVGGAVTIAKNAGSTGTFDIGGGTLAANSLTVGVSGNGSLEATSANVTVAGAVTIAQSAGSTGVIDLGDGTLEVGSLKGGAGESTLRTDGATIRFVSDGELFTGLTAVESSGKAVTVDVNGHSVTLGQAPDDCALHFAGSGSVVIPVGVTPTNYTFDRTVRFVWEEKGPTETISQTEGFVKDEAAHRFAGNATLRFDIASGASRTLTGTLGVGSFEKVGGGRLELSNPDDYLADIVLGGGTLAFGENAPNMFSSPFAIGNSEDNTLTVVDTATDVTMSFPTADFKGAFAKRGAGRLTLSRSGSWIDYKSLTAPRIDSTFTPDDTPPTFGDGSTLPTTGFTHVNAVEGRLTIRGGNADGSRNSFRFSQKCWAVGIPVADALAAQPELEFADISIDSLSAITLAPAISEGSAVTDPKLIITNSSVSGTYLVAAYKSTSPLLRPVVRATDSTLTTTFTRFNGGYNNGSDKVISDWRFVRSRLYASTRIEFAHSSHVEFNASVLAKKSTLEPVSVTFYGANTNTLVFANGSKFYFCNDFGESAAHAQTWIFDDSTWLWNAAAGDYTYALAAKAKVNLVMRGKGLVLEPAVGTKSTVATALTGEGGFVNRGEGTVVLPGDCIKYTGVTCAESGVIDFGGASVTNVTLAGAGAFVNGTLTDAKVLADGSAPQLGGVTLDGKVTVVFGETAPEIGTTVDVARYSGSLANWKVKRQSRDYSVTLTTDGTTVRAKIEPPKGLMLIFR